MTASSPQQHRSSSGASSPGPDPDLSQDGPGAGQPAPGALLGLLPKVSLHDHLDGSLRPATMLELAADAGHELPARSAEELQEWMRTQAASGSLPRYLSTFEHTLAVLQSAPALERAAREAVEDLAAENVLHAEVRWAPEQHLEDGLSMAEAVEAVARGLRAGVEGAAAQGQSISAVQLLCAMRQGGNSEEIAALVVQRYAPDQPGGVAGFDLAGPEDGFAPSGHTEALDMLARHLIPVTLHAGEAAGVDSIRDALVTGRALRLGHGVRIVEDIALQATADGDVSIDMGPVAQWVRDRGIVLEMCPASNAQTAAASSWNPPQALVDVLGPATSAHPIGFLHQAGFSIALSPDNRLMSATSITEEMHQLVNLHGFTLDDLEALQLTAARAAFVPLERRVQLEAMIAQAFAALREQGLDTGLGDMMARAAQERAEGGAR